MLSFHGKVQIENHFLHLKYNDKILAFSYSIVMSREDKIYHTSVILAKPPKVKKYVVQIQTTGQ